MNAPRLALSLVLLTALGASTDTAAQVAKKAPRVVSCDSDCVARRAAKLEAAKKERLERRKAASLEAAKKERLEMRKALSKKAAQAEDRRQMEAEIAASKAIEAKRAKEPGIVRQTCQMVGGKLDCK